jgi:putative SOS response-associated peptidase YedK
MCGRYTFKTHASATAEHYELDDAPEDDDLGPRTNIAPSQAVPVVRLDAAGRRRLSLLKWGLVPHWSESPKASFSNINARSESVARSPAFRAAFKSRRCLMLADGFYEWDAGPPKVPHYFRLKDGGPFAFAALWESWGEGADAFESCALITTEANGVVAPVHHRMPAMLDRPDYARWLDPEATPKALAALLAPFPDALMDGYEVGTYVNNPRHEGPRCVEPVA